MRILKKTNLKLWIISILIGGGIACLLGDVETAVHIVTGMLIATVFIWFGVCETPELPK